MRDRVGVFHFLAHITGVDGSGYWSTFWGGIGADIGEFAILTVIYRKLNCHVQGCRRLGFHHVAGTSFITCRTHHPCRGNTAEAIHEAHAQAIANGAAPASCSVPGHDHAALAALVTPAPAPREPVG